ncbi:hypothetical protein HMPREF3187_01268 [Aerococcus christensenii]|uniref:Uncharacterized protein n=1 Tax=Aerococcus christensenii TaxID=87541 RepID=A0A133XV25_9LACT|nr:hypothetical protein HMPREF3187_01268 [Aerococcus christensenii]
MKDHPRIRGKKIFSFNRRSEDVGSPPHTREKAIKKLNPALGLGDHPRIRGKK